MKFSVSILCLNNLAPTKRCIDSIYAAGWFVNDGMELLIHDNGSTDGTKEYLSELSTRPEVIVTRSETNLGFIRPNIQNLAMAKGEFYILLNNDCVVPPGWLEALEAPFKQFPSAAISGPEGSCSQLLPNFHGTAGKKEYIEGSCLCIKTSIARQHRLFSPELIGAYGEDSDLSLRMRELGYTLHWVPLALKHTRGATSAMVPQVRQWQEANHQYLRRRWAHYLRVRSFDFPIMIRRADAWGDVLLTTAIARELRVQRPLSPIWVETNCTPIFRDNPNVSRCERKIAVSPSTLIIDLNMSYEAMKETSIIDAYIHYTKTILGGGFTVGSKVPELFLRTAEINKAEMQMGDGAWVTVHAGPVCWRSKEWGLPRFHALTKRLMDLGWKVALIGSNKTGPVGCALDFRGMTTIHEMAAIIQKSKLFIGLDSLPLHVAQAVGTPSVGLFGVTSAKHILTAANAVGVDSSAESAGLRHRTVGQREVDDGGTAMNTITPEHVLEHVPAL